MWCISDYLSQQDSVCVHCVCVHGDEGNKSPSSAVWLTDVLLMEFWKQRSTMAQSEKRHQDLLVSRYIQCMALSTRFIDEKKNI